MKKYRYFMSGMFCPTDGEEYEINIPSPFLHNSKDEAMGDGSLGYRFIWLDDAIGAQIAVFKSEKFEVTTDKNEKCLKQWVEGGIVALYTFEDFKKANGYIRMLKPERKRSGFIDGDVDFLDTDKTFNDVFPNMQKLKLYYIDNEAYYIEEMRNDE